MRNGQLFPRARALTLALAFLLIGTSACVAYLEAREPGPRRGPTGSSVSVGFFYDTLAPYGTWIEVETYGWVWMPDGVAVDWRPYTHGHWAYTTTYGWTWISDWTWGWAPFHYGRWARHHRHGWIWVPGSVWAPAWVAWRVGDGWIGWAPFPPQVRWSVGIGLDLGDLDLRVAIASDRWIFVPERQFLDLRLQTRIADPGRNGSLLGLTRDATRYVAEGRWVAERGVSAQRLERVTGQPVTRYRIEDLARPPGRVLGNAGPATVRVYRPEVKERSDRAPSRGRGRKTNRG